MSLRVEGAHRNRPCRCPDVFRTYACVFGIRIENGGRRFSLDNYLGPDVRRIRRVAVSRARVRVLRPAHHVAQKYQHLSSPPCICQCLVAAVVLRPDASAMAQSGAPMSPPTLTEISNAPGSQTIDEGSIPCINLLLAKHFNREKARYDGARSCDFPVVLWAGR
jgi:hypothetical protein